MPRVFRNKLFWGQSREFQKISRETEHIVKKCPACITVKTLRFPDRALPTAGGLSIVLSEAFSKVKAETDSGLRYLPCPGIQLSAASKNGPRYWRKLYVPHLYEVLRYDCESASCRTSGTVDETRDDRTQSQNVTRAIPQPTTRNMSSQIKDIFDEIVVTRQVI